MRIDIARNYGIFKSKSDLVAFIDEDAIARKDFLRNIIEYFNDYSSVNCLGGKIEIYDNQNEFHLFHDSFFAVYMSDPKSLLELICLLEIIFNKSRCFQPEFTYRGDESVLFENQKIY